MFFGGKRNLIKFKHKSFSIIQIIIGTAIIAFSVDFFLLPNQLSTGGFSGIGTIVFYLTKIPVGTAVLALNIPLFIISYIKNGKKFLLNTILGALLLSLMLNLFDGHGAFTYDKLLASIYGGILSGIGGAIVLRANGSTGGTDILANIIKAYKPGFKTGTLIVILDTTIVVMSVMFFKNIEVGLYSAIAIFLMGKMIDIIFEGINFAKMIFIISYKNEKIAKEISIQMKRGVTSLYGKGMYRNEEREILLCIVSRNEVGNVMKIAKGIDRNSFIIISNAREVYGEGFK